MKTKYNTTYVLLERGVEDVALMKEIEKIAWTHHGGPYNKEFREEFPALKELLQGLQVEDRERRLRDEV